MVDTSLFHNSNQRIHIKTLIPDLKHKFQKLYTQKFMLSGELACMIQMGYQGCIMYIQKIIRGFLSRLKTNKKRILLIYLSSHIAVIMIQTWIRCIMQKKLYLKLKEIRLFKRLNFFVVFIQTLVRGWLKRKIYRKVCECLCLFMYGCICKYVSVYIFMLMYIAFCEGMD